VFGKQLSEIAIWAQKALFKNATQPFRNSFL